MVIVKVTLGINKLSVVEVISKTPFGEIVPIPTCASLTIENRTSNTIHIHLKFS